MPKRDPRPIEPAGADAFDRLVPDAIVADELGISAMTLYRWDHGDAAMIAAGWPAPIVYKKRKFRSRRQIEIFKENLLKRAIHERGQKRSAP